MLAINALPRKTIAAFCASFMLSGCASLSATFAAPQAPEPVVQAEPAQKFTGDVSAASPDGDIEITFDGEGGAPAYAITFKGETVVSRSRLGLRFADQQGLDEDLQIVGVSKSAVDESWEQPWGERRLVRDTHNEIAVEYADLDDISRRYTLRARVFDSGVGFRYEVPAQSEDEVVIVDEITQFVFFPEATAWWIPSNRFNRYEYVYRTTPIAEASHAHTPFTLRTDDGVHVSIHEAGLVDFSSMSLRQLRDGYFEADLRAASDGAKTRKTGAFNTPWRTIQISEDAPGLINSDIILNLNEPNALGDVSWVETGKYIGIWWGMHINTMTWGSGPKHGATTENAKRYIDFAAEHGFIGVLIEGWNTGWDGDWFNNGDLFSFTESYPDFDIEEVARYAEDKGVRLIGHHETSGNITNYENQLEDAFDLYEQLGVRGVKTGYVADAGDIKRVDENGVVQYEWHDSQIMANHHLKVVKEAAKRKISINAHEPIKDTGLRRTYPNWITREGARGMEFNAWGTPPNPPEHEPILAFTRMLSGPMDFTPGIFDLFPNGEDDQNRPQTTLAKQLALYVVLYSPLQMAADLPKNYEARPDAFQFIKDVPADWEDSRALSGEIGDYVVIARKDRASEDWYVGAVTDEEARQIPLSFDFLDPGGIYEATIYRDGEDADWETNPYPLTIETQTIRANDLMMLDLAAGGGAAIQLRRVE